MMTENAEPDIVVVAPGCLDAPSFLALGRDYLAEILSDRPAEEREAYLQSMLARQGEPDRWLLMLKVVGEPTGLVHAKIDRDDRPGWGYILEFYIRPQSRNSGRGRFLCDYVLNLFRERSVEDVWLTANPPPEGFWRSCGFKETGEMEGGNKIMAMSLHNTSGSTRLSQKPTLWFHPDADLDARAAEWYDQIETGTDDVELIRKLIGDRGPLRILEPMCGTGRILIPLAMDGHELVGIDISKAMLDRACVNSEHLPEEVRRRISLIHADVTKDIWPQDFDVVVLGGNWAFQLPTAEVQERCIASAATSLKPGGYLFHDSDHMEGELPENWGVPGIKEGKPWTSPDGVLFEPSSETIWYDAAARLHRSRRRTVVTYPDGRKVQAEHIVQKQPVSQGEIRGWLEERGFTIEWADETEGRITYWARKE